MCFGLKYFYKHKKLSQFSKWHQSSKALIAKNEINKSFCALSLSVCIKCYWHTVEWGRVNLSWEVQTTSKDKLFMTFSAESEISQTWEPWNSGSWAKISKISHKWLVYLKTEVSHYMMEICGLQGQNQQ